MGGENYSSSLFGDAEDAVPQKPFSFRVHAGGGLVLRRVKEIKELRKRLSVKESSQNTHALQQPYNTLEARTETDIAIVSPKNKILTNHIIKEQLA